MKNKIKNYVWRWYLLLGTITMPATVFSDTNTDKVQSILQGLADLLSGTWARLIFIIAIIGVGYGLISGKMEKGRALMIVLGIAIVFSASYIATTIGVTA